MRVWRFDDNGTRIDPATLPDTFMLARPDSLSLHFEDRSQFDRLKRIADEYDYVCFWQGDIFPVYDEETTTKDVLLLARNERKDDGLVFRSCFPIWNRGI